MTTSLNQLNKAAYDSMTVSVMQPDISYAWQSPKIQNVTFQGDRYVHYQRGGFEELLVDETNSQSTKMDVVAKYGYVRNWTTGVVTVSRIQSASYATDTIDQDIYNEIKRSVDVSRERGFFASMYVGSEFGEQGRTSREPDVNAANVAAGVIKCTGTSGSRSEDCTIISANYAGQGSVSTTPLGLTYDKLVLASNILRAKGAAEVFVAVPSAVNADFLSAAASSNAASSFSNFMTSNQGSIQDVLTGRMSQAVGGCVPIMTEFTPGTSSFGGGNGLANVNGLSPVLGNTNAAMLTKYNVSLNNSVDANRDFGTFTANTTVNGVQWLANQNKIMIPVFTPSAICNLFNSKLPMEIASETKNLERSFNTTYNATWTFGNMKKFMEGVVFIECLWR